LPLSEGRYGPLSASYAFDASSSSDADGETLSFEWDPENDGSFEAPSSNPRKTLTFGSAVNRTVAVRVRDTSGAATVARVTVYPGDTPPVPAISAPPAIERTLVDLNVAVGNLAVSSQSALFSSSVSLALVVMTLAVGSVTATVAESGLAGSMVSVPVPPEKVPAKGEIPMWLTLNVTCVWLGSTA
jgi:hypothetical protein